MMSVEEYRRLKRRAREVLAVEELSAEDLQALQDAQVPAEHAHLNAELG
jgi:predicted metal-binding transcription factor (methanogenesis marker protein 9)